MLKEEEEGGRCDWHTCSIIRALQIQTQTAP